MYRWDIFPNFIQPPSCLLRKDVLCHVTQKEVYFVFIGTLQKFPFSGLPISRILHLTGS
jgi:hypothetical protein